MIGIHPQCRDVTRALAQEPGPVPQNLKPMRLQLLKPAHEEGMLCSKKPPKRREAHTLYWTVASATAAARKACTAAKTQRSKRKQTERKKHSNKDPMQPRKKQTEKKNHDYPNRRTKEFDKIQHLMQQFKKKKLTVN